MQRTRGRRNLRTIKYLTQDELRRLFGVITNRRDRAIFLIAYRHGLRPSEVGLLKLSDVDLPRGRIAIERLKGSQSGEFPLEADEVEAIEAWLEVRWGSRFTEDQITKLLSAIDKTRDRAIFLLASRHGLGTSEVRFLKLTDIDLSRGTMRIERLKALQDGEFPLQPDELEALQAWLEVREDDGFWLFPGRMGSPICPRTLDYLMGRYTKRAALPSGYFHALKPCMPCAANHSSWLFPSHTGVPIHRRTLDRLTKAYGERAAIPPEKRHFHVLRHSIATHLLDAGADIKFVQDWIGHRNISNTVVYAQLSNTARDEQARKLFASPMIVATHEHKKVQVVSSLDQLLYEKYCPVLAR